MSKLNLEYFYKDLARMDVVQRAILDADPLYGFQDIRKEKIIEEMKAGIEFEESDYVYDLLSNLINNESEGVKSFENGNTNEYGPADILILKFGPVYWAQCIECDDEQYFSSLKDAEDAANGAFYRY